MGHAADGSRRRALPRQFAKMPRTRSRPLCFFVMIKSPRERGMRANSSGHRELLGTPGALLTDANLRRGPILQAGQYTQGRRQEGHVDHHGPRFSKLEPEHKCGRAPPTAMEPRSDKFLEVRKGFSCGQRSEREQQAMASHHAERASTMAGICCLSSQRDPPLAACTTRSAASCRFREGQEWWRSLIRAHQLWRVFDAVHGFCE